MNIGTYETSDLYLAVTLYSFGYELVSVDRSNPNRAVFGFKYERGLNDVVRGFFNDKLSLNPRTFSMNIKPIKDRLYAGV